MKPRLLIAVMLSLMVGYLLSIGPVMWWFARTATKAPDWLGTFYVPLGIVCQHSRIFKHAIEKYIEAGLPEGAIFDPSN